VYHIDMRNLIALAFVLTVPSLALAAGKLDTAKIESLTGAKGKLDEKEGVFKVSLPRSDLAVVSGGVKITPPMGLTAWAAFKNVGGHVVVMGDMVLTEDQVPAAMDAALGAGLEVTALHNHFFFDNPHVMFMHIGGMGTEEQLAGGVGKVFAVLKAPGVLPVEAAIDPARSSLDPKKLDVALGATGTYQDGVYKATWGRTTKMHGGEMGTVMGVNTWSAFAGSDDQAVVDGDFAMLESELQPVLKALRAGGIQIVAIHQHMTGEEPRVLFLHYWGVGHAEDLAKTLRAALDLTKTPRGK
jgi:hypothetical protein